MDEAGSGSLGLGDSSYSSTGSGKTRRVPATVAGYPAVALGYPAAAAVHAAAVTWIYVACCYCYWGSTTIAYTSARPTYHHFTDSSCIAQWASESGIASYSVCFTYRAGVLVVCFASDSLGSSLHSHCYEFHFASEFLSASD